MTSGFVKLRRGIIEHLESGKITADEYCAYTLIILLANHKNGQWRGCAQSLSRKTKWSTRQSQVVLKSLREKGYLIGTPSTGRGQYNMRVVKYFEKAHRDAAFVPEGAPGCGLMPKKAHGGATYQEVIQEGTTFKKARKPYSSVLLVPRSSGGALTRMVTPPVDLSKPGGWESRAQYQRGLRNGS